MKGVDLIQGQFIEFCLPLSKSLLTDSTTENGEDVELMKLTSTCKSQKPELLLPERFTVADEIHQSEITPFSVTSVIP